MKNKQNSSLADYQASIEECIALSREIPLNQDFSERIRKCYEAGLNESQAIKAIDDNKIPADE